MTTIDVNTGRFIGKGKSLEETVTRCNLEASEEIARQLRLRDIGGMVMIDYVDMVMPANRDLVLRRLVECLARDRTKHQVAEVTSLGLVQMTRKRIGQGLVEAFSEECPTCKGRGFILHDQPTRPTSMVEALPQLRNRPAPALMSRPNWPRLQLLPWPPTTPRRSSIRQMFHAGIPSVAKSRGVSCLTRR